jgi:hypothetical protein
MFFIIGRKKLERLVDERIDQFLQEGPADLAGVTYEPIFEDPEVLT